MWDAERVGQAIVQAFVTLAMMPVAAGPRAPGGNWPTTMTEWGDQLGIDPIERKMREEAANRGRRPQPSGEEIKHMEAAFEWLSELRREDPGMALVTGLWALRVSQGRSIKRLCADKLWAPRTFFRKREKALCIVAASLNARGVLVWEVCHPQPLRATQIGLY